MSFLFWGGLYTIATMVIGAVLWENRVELVAWGKAVLARVGKKSD